MVDEGLTSDEDVKKAIESLRLKAATYHEKLLADGYRFDRFVCCNTLESVPNDIQIKGLQKIVIIPVSLLPELMHPNINHEDFRCHYYGLYVQSR